MKRHLAESRFKTYGILGIISATVFLIVILSTIFIEGKSAFKSTYIKLDVFFDPSIIDPDGTRDIDEIRFANYRKVIKNSLSTEYLKFFIIYLMLTIINIIVAKCINLNRKIILENSKGSKK